MTAGHDATLCTLPYKTSLCAMLLFQEYHPHLTDHLHESLDDQASGCTCTGASDSLQCFAGGVTVGEGCIIGAGAVVSKDVPPWSVAVGNPAKVVRKIQPDDRSKREYDMM